MSDLESLAAISRRIGENSAYVQGGGGNTSLKTGDATMHIKASGITLASATATNGFAPLDWRKLRKDLPSCQTEGDYVGTLRSAQLGHDHRLRPSIETGLHALLGACVIHTHSVWANLLTCSEGGKQRAVELFPHAVWIPYATPGLPLTRRVSELLEAHPDPSVLFLENHGLVVVGPDTATTATLHASINLKIRQYFGLETDAYPGATEGLIVGEDRLLFPDQAVYLTDPTLARSEAAAETRQAVRFLLATMPLLGLSPRFLGEAECTELVGLEAEKYRQKVAQA